MKNLTPTSDQSNSSQLQSPNPGQPSPSPRSPLPCFACESTLTENYEAPIDCCCEEKQKVIVELSAQRDTYKEAFMVAKQQIRQQDELNAAYLDEMSKTHKASVDEMRQLLAHQRKLGDRWKNEMELLTQRFEQRFRKLSSENRKLRSSVEQLSKELSSKIDEADEAKEMNGIYSARLTQMKKTVKKLKNMDEESYIEITF